MAWLYRLLKTIMLKVYTGAPIANLPYLELLWPNWGARPTGRWSELAFQYLTDSLVLVVANPAEADYLLLPHNWTLVKNNHNYLNHWQKIINEYGKKLIIFNPGDSDQPVSFGMAIVFRHSQYRSNLRSNEIILPGYVEDLGGREVDIRVKSKKPVVGFCGWAKAGSKWASLKMLVKTFLTYPIYYRRGLWWRNQVLSLLQKSDLVTTDFIIRGSYSGNEKTIELDPVQARREYLNNISNTDFTVCVRGDGNFSTRFYEVLSLGRLPLFIDTDCPLPLADRIDYDQVMIRVNYDQINTIAQKVNKTYRLWSEEEYAKKQQRARALFENYLRLDQFLKITLTQEFLKQYA